MDLRQSSTTLANGRKRKRVTRACDECRQNKVKCDGKQPCLLCISHEFECTYDRPSSRSRKFPATSAEAIENRLQQIESTLHAVLDRGLTGNVPPPQTAPAHQALPTSNDQAQAVQSGTGNRLEIALDGADQLDVDDDGHHDFHGHSSGFAFLAEMRHKYEDLLSPDAESRTTVETPPEMPQIFDPRQPFTIPVAFVPPTLPSRATAEELVESALEYVCALSRTVHRPTFDAMFKRVYDLGPAKHKTQELRFLPLLYAVMAVGSFASTIKDEGSGNKRVMAAGVEFFLAAKQMTDVTDCRDIMGLQTIMFLVVYLQCSSRMSACYTYVGLALKSALRMGMHRRVTASFTPLECQTRSRIFWVLRKVDIYVSTMLGLPDSIADDQIDQEMPLEVDDECILEDRVLPQPSGRLASIASTNAHIRLMGILKKITTYVYPLKGVEQNISGKTRVYFVDHSKIHEIENALKQWLDGLPSSLKEPASVSERLASLLLRTSYHHVRLVLYRPFTHRLSNTEPKTPFEGQAQAAAAAACLSAAKHIVHITEEMKEALLTPGHWFALYATFFAVFSLVYFVLENPSDERAPVVFEEAKRGRELLVSFRERSPIAARCSTSLKALFDRLPETLAKCLHDASLAKLYRGAPRSESSSPEDGLAILNDYFRTNGTAQSQSDDKMCHTPGIAASMPVNVNFTTGSAPKPMGGSFQIRSTSNGPILNDSQFNLNPQSLDLARQSVRMRHTEGMPLPNLNASNVLAGNSVTNAYQTIPGLAPLLQDPNVAVRPGEEMTDFLNPHLVRGFPEVQRLDHSPMSSTAGLPAPEQEACGNSWGSYDFIDEFPQANGGPDINLAYFFNEHEWERH